MNDPLVEPAPAKVNFALSVGSPRADGMHPVCSWMVTVDLCDELHLVQLDPGSISRYAITWHEQARRRSDIDWPISSDLAVRAHLALERVTGRQLCLQACLKKRVPVGGGLGGGSADAAAMLRGCNRLFDLGLGLDHLRCIAAELGSDVPFLVDGGSAIVQGVGGEIEPLADPPDTHIVLLLPDLACSTADVYHRFDELGGATLDPGLVRDATDTGDCFNDLARATFDLHPALGEIAGKIGRLVSRAVHVSGSGSTLFVTCDTAVEAEAFVDRIEHALDLPALYVRPCASVIAEHANPDRS